MLLCFSEGQAPSKPHCERMLMQQLQGQALFEVHQSWGSQFVVYLTFVSMPTVLSCLCQTFGRKASFLSACMTPCDQPNMMQNPV